MFSRIPHVHFVEKRRTTSTKMATPSLNLSTPSVPQEHCDSFQDATLVKVIKTIAYSVLMILSLGGNSLVIAVIYRNRNLRTIINLFVLNISVSDLLLLVFGHTKRIKEIYHPSDMWLVDGLFGSIICKLTEFGENTSILVSILTMEVIAVERFFGVVFPMKRQPIRSKKACFIAIALVWLIGAMYPSLSFYVFKLIHKGTTPYCIYSWEPAFGHAEAVKIAFPVVLVAFTMIPFLFLTTLYSAIIISLHRQKANLHLAPEATQRRVKKYRQITHMLVAMVVVFLVSWLPINIYLFLTAFVWSSHTPCESRHLIFSALFLSYSFPAINPVIYYIFNDEYKKGFQELWCYLTRCRKHSSSSPVEGNITYNVDPSSSKGIVLLSVLPIEFAK